MQHLSDSIPMVDFQNILGNITTEHVNLLSVVLQQIGWAGS